MRLIFHRTNCWIIYVCDLIALNLNDPCKIKQLKVACSTHYELIKLLENIRGGSHRRNSETENVLYEDE